MAGFNYVDFIAFLYVFIDTVCYFSPSVCPTQAEDTVVAVPFKSRHVRLVLKGPDHLCKSW